MIDFHQKILGMRHPVRGTKMPARANTLPYHVVQLTSWRPKGGGVNFGDEMARIITVLMLAQRGLTLEDEVSRARQLLTIGSVMHLARSGATVWGSGVNGKVDERLHRFDYLDVRAVRGPLTRKFLRARGLQVPEVYGDPALLISGFASRFLSEEPSDIVFVPNLNDAAIPFTLPPNVTLVDPRQSWNRVLGAIGRAKFVIASSLHGIIVAEAFGIPARYVRLSDHEHMFKYEDYYEGTGRATYRYATTIDQALELGGERSHQADLQLLASAFPYDLWDV